MAGNQHTFTVADMLKEKFIPERRGKMHIHEHTALKGIGTAVTNTGDEWRGYDLGRGVPASLLLLHIIISHTNKSVTQKNKTSFMLSFALSYSYRCTLNKKVTSQTSITD